MLDQVLDVFDIIPFYDLDIMRECQSLADITCNIISSIEPIFDDFKPDLVLVHGDTTTSMSVSIAAFYNKIDVGHIEAGLRTHNINSPWPEEFNRRVNGLIAKYHYSPTILCQENLLTEGVDKNGIVVSGNTVIDAVQSLVKRIENDAFFERHITETLKMNIP